MSEYRFTATQRYAVWKYHGPMCHWCGEPLRFLDVEVDHLVPEHLEKKPTELAEFKRGYGLDDTFLINDFNNWVPCHPACNRSKGGKALPPVPYMITLLGRLRRDAEKVRAIARAVEDNQKKDAVLGKFLAAVDQGSVSKDDILAFIARSSSSDEHLMAIREQVRADPANWQVLATVERAVDAGLSAALTVIVVCPRGTTTWRPVFARADMARESDLAVRGSEDLGIVRVLHERIEGQVLLARLRDAMIGGPFACANVDFAEHGLARPWKSKRYDSWRRILSDRPCTHSLSAQFDADVEYSEILYGPPGGSVYDNIHELTKAVSRFPTSAQVPPPYCYLGVADPRRRNFNLVVWDYRGRVQVLQRGQRTAILKTDVEVEAQLVGSLQFGNGRRVVLNEFATMGTTVRDLPGVPIGGKLRLQSPTGECLDDWPYPGQIVPGVIYD